MCSNYTSLHFYLYASHRILVYEQLQYGGAMLDCCKIILQKRICDKLHQTECQILTLPLLQHTYLHTGYKFMVDLCVQLPCTPFLHLCLTYGCSSASILKIWYRDVSSLWVSQYSEPHCSEKMECLTQTLKILKFQCQVLKIFINQSRTFHLKIILKYLKIYIFTKNY